MPPTKNTELSQKVLRKRVLKDKPVKAKLKTPVVKVQIQGIGSNTKPKLQRHVTFEQKIALANEVALAQLVKSPSVEVVPDDSKHKPLPVINKTPTRKTTSLTKESDGTAVKPGRKRKQIPNANSAVDSELDDTSLATPVVTKLKRKRKPTQNVLSLKVVSAKNEIDTHSQVSKISTNQTPLVQIQNPVKLAKPRTRSVTATPLQNKTVALTLTNGHDMTDVLKETVKPVPVPKAKGSGRKRKQKINEEYHNNIIPQVPTFDSASPVKDVIGKKKASTVAATKRPGRPKLNTGRTNVKTTLKNKISDTRGEVFNAAEIKAAASELEKALKNTVPTHIDTPCSNLLKSSNSVENDNSNLSWTKDISASSSITCLTVSSGSFVCFDNKVPVVELNDIIVKREIKEQDSSSSSSDSESSDSSQDTTDRHSRQELNLSTTSSSVRSEQTNTERLDSTELLCLEMDKLTNSLNNFYTEMEKWIVYDDDETCTLSNVFEALDLEKNLLTNCENFKSITGKVDCDKIIETPAENAEEVEFAKPCFRSPSATRRGTKAPNVTGAVTSHPAALEEKGSHESENFTSDNYNYGPFDKAYEDDDALSLFAESITGIDSSRMNSSVASNSNVSAHDVYVPATKTAPPDTYTYQPTRIGAEPLKPRTVCEKQNADSTSIRESEINKKATDITHGASGSSLAHAPPRSPNVYAPESLKKPQLFLLGCHSKANPVRSKVYNGICFFHVAGGCKNRVCKFPHAQLEKQHAENRIMELDKDDFIKEYLLTSAYATLRRKYGLLFLEECMRRAYTRILIEMAIDLGVKFLSTEEYPLQVFTLECTLMHLNTVSLDACDDLLKLQVTGSMLCEILLRTVADTQNFARFKPVFLKLATFMSDIGREIEVDVVGKILERVCILPFEDALARSMLSLIKNTDRVIFQNSMIEQFEVRLEKLEGDLYEEYLLEKKAAIEALLERPYGGEEPPKQSTDTAAERERYTSPDTTHLDGLKKGMTHNTPTIIRTVDVRRSIINTTMRRPTPLTPIPAFTPGPWSDGAGRPSWRARGARGMRHIRPARTVVYRPGYGGGGNDDFI